MTSSTSTLIAAIAAAVGGGGGNLFTDPNRFPKAITIGNSTTNGLNIGGADFTGEAAFWTDLANRGVAVDSAFSADTNKTLLNASGRGIMYGAISPAISNGADTVYFRITRDGTETVVSFAPGTVNYRLFLGWVNYASAFGADNSMSTLNDVAAFDATKTVHNLATGTSWQVTDPAILALWGVGLTFSSSLLVECKVTNAQSTTANQERQAGVLYRMGM